MSEARWKQLIDERYRKLEQADNQEDDEIVNADADDGADESGEEDDEGDTAGPMKSLFQRMRDWYEEEWKQYIDEKLDDGKHKVLMQKVLRPFVELVSHSVCGL